MFLVSKTLGEFLNLDNYRHSLKSILEILETLETLETLVLTLGTRYSLELTKY